MFMRRRRAGVPTGDVLAALESFPTEQRLAAEAAILAVEEEVCASDISVIARSRAFLRHACSQALPRMQLMPGVLQLCSFLDKRSIPRGLITRNSQRSLDFFHQRHFQNMSAFAPALSRAFRPYKPSPGGILHICREWSIHPSECLMVGDSPKDDVRLSSLLALACSLLMAEGVAAS